ncbi:hypothetical protein QZH41_001303 [Actinostola sp. cb2023]|nr:hypothetical protein QZH41_001303 [Actinostola sp. cb2023]
MKTLLLLIAFSFLFGCCFSAPLDAMDAEVEKRSTLSELLGKVTNMVNELKRQIYTGRRMITSLQRNYQSLSGKVRVVESRTANLQGRMNSALVKCHNMETEWQPYSNAPIMYLDRHRLNCPAKHFLSSFVLRRNGASRALMFTRIFSAHQIKVRIISVESSFLTSKKAYAAMQSRMLIA